MTPGHRAYRAGDWTRSRSATPGSGTMTRLSLLCLNDIRPVSQAKRHPRRFVSARNSMPRRTLPYDQLLLTQGRSLHGQNRAALVQPAKDIRAFAGYSGEYPGPRDPEIFMEGFRVDEETQCLRSCRLAAAAAATMTLANPASRGNLSELSLARDVSVLFTSGNFIVGKGDTNTIVPASYPWVTSAGGMTSLRANPPLQMRRLLSIPGLQTIFGDLGDSPDVAAQTLDSVITLSGYGLDRLDTCRGSDYLVSHSNWHPPAWFSSNSDCMARISQLEPPGL
ncbi:hypothetical protein EDB87DRAFT_1685883 [Lactarius vividus]|nr:hypothetical protein EDB87DRAFT_1685883 [Lactarius vividus]